MDRESERPGHTLSCADIPALHDAGVGPLHPIIPPNATLSALSKIPPEKLGKIPGMRGSDGWYGFDWAKHTRSTHDLRRWAKYGADAGVGLLCGEGFVAIDIDITDPTLAAIAQSAVVEVLGLTPVRTGNAPKTLLLYRCAEPVTGFRVHLIDDSGQKHLIEVLGVGQQFVLGGIHPKTGKPYSWDMSLPQAMLQDPDEYPAGVVRTADPFDIQVAIDSAVQALSSFGVALDSTKRSSNGSRDTTRDQTDLVAPDAEHLARALAVIPNIYPDRDRYIRIGCAIKAATASDPAAGEQLFQDWASTRSDGSSSDPGAVSADWQRMKPPFAVGYQYLIDLASEFDTSFAQQTATSEFNSAHVPALPPLEPGEHDPSSPEAKAQRKTAASKSNSSKARKPRSGDEDSSPAGMPLPDDVWGRYVYVESLERFIDLDSKVHLTKGQFKDRHADIGDPTTRDNAASRYLADMDKRRVVQRTTYRPGADLLLNEDGDAAVNVWRGGAFFGEAWAATHATDVDIAEYLALASHILPVPEERDLFLDWMAFQLQQPGVKCNWHVVLGSRHHGLGKDTLLEPLVRGLGERNCPVISACDLQSQWTDWLYNGALVRVEEMNSFGRREVMDRIKPYLAAPPAELRVNIKGIPQFKTPNIVNLCFFTNHEDAIAIEDGDRRFFVSWSDAEPWSEDRFAKLYDWLHNKGGDRLVCAWLARRDLSRFSPKGRALMTEAKATMVSAGRSAIDAGVQEGIERGLGCLRADLVTTTQVLSYLGALPSVRHAATSTRAGIALRKAGAVTLGQVRIDGTRERVWALRRHGMYVGLEDNKVRELVIKAQDDLSESDFAALALTPGTPGGGAGGKGSKAKGR